MLDNREIFIAMKYTQCTITMLFFYIYILVIFFFPYCHFIWIPGKGKKIKNIKTWTQAGSKLCDSEQISQHSVCSLHISKIRDWFRTSLALLTLWNRSFYLWGGVRGDCSVPEECLAHSWLIPTRCL